MRTKSNTERNYFAKITNAGKVKHAWEIQAPTIHEARKKAREYKEQEQIEGLLEVRSRTPGPTASREMYPFNVEIYKLNAGMFETGAVLQMDNFETIDSALIEGHERVPNDWLFYKIVIYKEQEEVYCQDFTNN